MKNYVGGIQLHLIKYWSGDNHCFFNRGVERLAMRNVESILNRTGRALVPDELPS